MTVADKALAGPPSVDWAEDALLLDIDGTLLDIADTPDEVTVPPRLREDLSRLKGNFAGALALVSGRSLKTIDKLFAPLKLAAAGCHGAEIRPAAEAPEIARAAPIDRTLKQSLFALEAQFPGIIMEDKSYSVALHYRAVPQKGEVLLQAARAICAQEKTHGFDILHGKYVIEIKPANIGKGRAVKELLAQTPFAGRRPVFLGDDVTDEAVFAILGAFDGVGISVGRTMAGVRFVFRTPGEVRSWLHQLASAKVDGR